MGFAIQVLYCFVREFVNGCLFSSEPMDLWTLIEKPLKFAQTAALLEIVHSMLGFVRSPVMTTTLQGIYLYFHYNNIVFSRILLLWGYANPCPDAQHSWSIKLMVLSWSLVEVPRYLFYLVKLLNIPMPTWLLFLRYNLFIVLYPTGITGMKFEFKLRIGEYFTIINSLKYIKQTGMLSVSLPNPWNIAIDFYGISIFMLIIYIPCIILR